MPRVCPTKPNHFVSFQTIVFQSVSNMRHSHGEKGKMQFSKFWTNPAEGKTRSAPRTRAPRPRSKTVRPFSGPAVLEFQNSFFGKVLGDAKSPISGEMSARGTTNQHHTGGHYFYTTSCDRHVVRTRTSKLYHGVSWLKTHHCPQ